MADVSPFRGIFYNRDKVDGRDVTAPPYDVIPPRMRDVLYEKSPFNIIRIDAGRDQEGDTGDSNKYTRAASLMREWLDEGILVQSERPIYFAYRMSYTLGGVSSGLTGIFAAVRIVELGEGVYPHEATHSKPKHDRMELMRHTGANTSPIFSLYNRSKGHVADVLGRVTSGGGGPYMSAPDHDGHLHEFWMIEAPADIEAIRADLEGSDIFIADGHHRYETALAYKKAQPESDRVMPHDYVLMFLADMYDPGLAVLPTHRLLTMDACENIDRIGRYFELERVEPGADMPALIRGRRSTLGMYTGGCAYLLRYKGNADDVAASGVLDVELLDNIIIKGMLGAEQLVYEMDVAEVRRLVDEGKYAAGFFLNPTSVRDVERVALRGERMPPKSTYFYPKVRTGFVMSSIK